MKIIIVLIGFLSLSVLFMGTFAYGLNFVTDYGTIVQKIGSKYFARDSQNKIIVSGDTPDIVIKTALNRGGEIYISGGKYILSSDFSGFDLKSYTHLKLAQDADIVVPSGYGGHVFRFKSGTAHCVLEGGNIHESKPIERRWIGVLMQGGPSGVYFNYIENMAITDPYIVINFNATTKQWVNANTFVNIRGETFVRGIEFDFKGDHTYDDGFVGNTFRDIQLQSGPMSTYGVKDIQRVYTTFYNVQVWDLPFNATSSSIDPSAKYTIIIGGIMTRWNFEDHGKNTIVLDAWHNTFFSNSTISSDIIKGGYHPKIYIPNPSFPHDLNMSMPQQPNTGFVHGNDARIIISEHPAALNVYGKVNVPAGGEVILYVIRPDGVIEQNPAYITSDGSFFYPMSFDRNSLTGQYRIDALYQNSNFGSLFLNVTSDKIPAQTETYVNPDIGLTESSKSNMTSFASFKNDAKLWSEEKMDDNAFGSDIQYLIKTGIMENPHGNQAFPYQSLHIPTWLKNNAKFWADSQLSDNDFISGLQYLLKIGIIQLVSQQNDSLK